MTDLTVPEVHVPEPVTPTDQPTFQLCPECDGVGLLHDEDCSYWVEADL